MSKFSPRPPLKCKGEQQAAAEIRHHGPDYSSSSGSSQLPLCYFDPVALSTHVNGGAGDKQ